MTRVKSYLDRMASSLGAYGIVGIGLALFSLALYISAIVPTREAARALRAKVAQLQPGARSSKPTERVRAPLSDFYDFFPAANTLPQYLAKIYGAAEREGINLSKGEYRLQSYGPGRLTSYQMVFPVKGSYPQIRRFVVAVLRDLPFAALGDLRLDKQRAEDTVIDSQIKLTLYLRST